MVTTVTRLNQVLSGRYTVERELGQGGMATVYLARDEKHNRSVALKVLKPELAAVVGAERFLAEIETTANLQHPHILPLYDSGHADSFLFYVMPYVEGETLRDRLDREKQLPVDEAVRLASTVANALDYAHRHGVIHRDIKPANILLQDGEPVVADFGIAIAIGAAGGARLTETGLSVGTPYYMSPEQATGDQALTSATDTYALGAVLYEMLTGDPPYVGSTAQAVLGKIIQGTSVPARTVRPSVPVHVDAAIRKALEKLPADRFPDMHEFARALSEPGFRYGEPEPARVAGSRSFWKPLSFALLGTTLALVAVLAWPRAADEAVRGVERFSAPFEEGEEPIILNRAGIRLSPDGSMLVYARQPGAATSFWMRRWSELTASPIRSTDGGIEPSVSPDGASIAFNQGGQIKTLDLAGGPVRSLGAGNFPFWADDGFVYFTAAEGVVRAPGGGGPIDVVVPRRDGDGVILVHQVLPGARTALATISVGDRPLNESDTYSLDLETGAAKRLVQGQDARYNRATGHLLYKTGATLMAVPFDARRAELTGQSVPVLEGVQYFEIADDGKLLYSIPSATASDLELAWVTRDGVARPVEAGWTFNPSDVNGNRSWSISPDGDRIALKIQTDLGADIWIKQLPNGPLSRLTFHEGEDRFVRWTQDGTALTFASDRSGALALWTRRADGTGDAELIASLDGGVAEGMWSPDGEWLILRSNGVGGVVGGRDIYGFRPGVDENPVPLVVTEFDESAVAFSPDGRWIAYQSNETGRREVFVRPFPEVARGKWQISSGGGRAPLWAHNGRELFFISDANEVMQADIDPGPPFVVGERRGLFTPGPAYYFANNTATWDIAPDDETFLMARAPGAGEPGTRYVVLVNNFAAELSARVPR